MTTLRYLYILVAISFGLLVHGCSPPLTQPLDQSPAIFFELAKKLSPGAAIVTPGPEHQRWSAYASPTYSIVVEVAEEEDVQKTVRVPFVSAMGLLDCSDSNPARSALRTSTATRSSRLMAPMAWFRPSQRCKEGSRYRLSG